MIFADFVGVSVDQVETVFNAQHGTYSPFIFLQDDSGKLQGLFFYQVQLHTSVPSWKKNRVFASIRFFEMSKTEQDVVNGWFSYNCDYGRTYNGCRVHSEGLLRSNSNSGRSRGVECCSGLRCLVVCNLPHFFSLWNSWFGCHWN